jgi:hypothetical protein
MFLMLQFDPCGLDCREKITPCQPTTRTSWNVNLSERDHPQ